MPLPPLPENNTDRAWLKYTSAGHEHEICFRLPSATAQSVFITTATAIADALKSALPSTDGFTGLRHSDSGSNLSFPLAFTPIAGTAATNFEPNDAAWFYALSGRSLGGYRCRITFFTPWQLDTQMYRVPTNTSGAPTALYTAVTGNTPALVAVDGGNVIWNGYVNCGYNAYWQRQFR